MKGAIYYYSGTGNTALACQYLKNRMLLPFDSVDVTLQKNVDAKGFDVFGFAAPTDFWGIPQAFESFIETFPMQNGKPGFVLNTYGAISGKTLRLLADLVSTRGINVFAGHSLRMPENFPPMIINGMGAQNEPGKKGMLHLNSFISAINEVVASFQKGRNIEARKIPVGLVNSLIPVRSRSAARDAMGEKYVDSSLCTECGICKKGCPYQAISLEPKPVFDMNKCHGCWRCFHKCPSKAIYTKKFRGKGRYKGPGEKLKNKMMA